MNLDEIQDLEAGTCGHCLVWFQMCKNRSFGPCDLSFSGRCLQGGIRSCGGCGEKILDRFLLLALDQYWHVNCLKCSCCNVRLGEVGSSCYAKGGMILCKTDYVKLYGSSGACAVCAKLIPATEFVMKVLGKVYHINCFNCTTCHNQLVAGDRFHVVNGRLFCENDDPRLLKQQLHATKQTVC